MVLGFLLGEKICEGGVWGCKWLGRVLKSLSWGIVFCPHQLVDWRVPGHRI